MAIKTYKPYTPSRRSMTGYSFSELTVSEPYKPLTKWLKSASGRNNQGRNTSIQLVNTYYRNNKTILSKQVFTFKRGKETMFNAVVLEAKDKILVMTYVKDDDEISIATIE